MAGTLSFNGNGARMLIVNADDFGQSAGINRGIVEAHERGIVTSVSLMVFWPAAVAAAAYARSRPALSVGLHVDLGEWTYRQGEWKMLYERIDPTDPDAVQREVSAQLDRCRDLLGGDPTHLDSHQHVHHKEPARAILQSMAVQLGVPLRHFSQAIRHCGDFYGQGKRGESMPHLIASSGLTAQLRRLPDGVNELGCHPGYADDLDTMYREERTVELQTLCDRDIQRIIADEGITLVSFRDVQRPWMYPVGCA
jgi:predicted glycoside hydrolase/deacetylase ChbG (UPF0249 family)